jgi:hypothetical protein
MRVTTLKYLLLFPLAGCFYGKVQLTQADRMYIPYNLPLQLVFTNSSNTEDTLFFERKLIHISNFDFFIDRLLDNTNNKKRPYIESYSTQINLSRTISKTQAKEQWIKFNPMSFSFRKSQADPTIIFHHNIAGSWDGTLSFDTVKTISLAVNKKTLSDVVLINNSTGSLFEIDKIYWSIKYGLVRIDEKSGNSWTILKFID